jgi:hypothetical protein
MRYVKYVLSLLILYVEIWINEQPEERQDSTIPFFADALDNIDRCQEEFSMLNDEKVNLKL